MHHVDANKTHGEKPRWELYKNALNRCKKQHLTKQMYGHLPPTSKTIQVKQTRYVGHCWRSKDELKWHFSMDPYTWMHQCGQELIHISSVQTQDVGWKMCQEWWMIGTDGERESRNSALSAWLNDYHLIYYIEFTPQTKIADSLNNSKLLC